LERLFDIITECFSGEQKDLDNLRENRQGTSSLDSGIASHRFEKPIVYLVTKRLLEDKKCFSNWTILWEDRYPNYPKIRKWCDLAMSNKPTQQEHGDWNYIEFGEWSPKKLEYECNKLQQVTLKKDPNFSGRYIVLYKHRKDSGKEIEASVQKHKLMLKSKITWAIKKRVSGIPISNYKDNASGLLEIAFLKVK
jgi:hypothetical protein